jgi:hypothetical protein
MSTQIKNRGLDLGASAGVALSDLDLEAEFRDLSDWVP